MGLLSVFLSVVAEHFLPIKFVNFPLQPSETKLYFLFEKKKEKRRKRRQKSRQIFTKLHNSSEKALENKVICNDEIAGMERLAVNL